MREILSWLSGAVLAFALTAGAFLLLANAGEPPSEKALRPDTRSAPSGPSLELQIPRDRINALKQEPDQTLTVGIRNSGDEKLSDISISAKVSSENTALPETRYERSSVASLAAGASATADFTLDLSFADKGPEPPRAIIEIRATTPSGVSTVKTVILPA